MVGWKWCPSMMEWHDEWRVARICCSWRCSIQRDEGRGLLNKGTNVDTEYIWSTHSYSQLPHNPEFNHNTSIATWEILQFVYSQRCFFLKFAKYSCLWFEINWNRIFSVLPCYYYCCRMSKKYRDPLPFSCTQSRTISKMPVEDRILLL